MPSTFCQMGPVARRRRRTAFRMVIRGGLALMNFVLPAMAAAGSALPKGFVYLRDIDPTIVQDIRYAGSHNFVGRPIRGYLAAECILSRPVARALEAVQRKLAEKKLSLIVWDCYRPKRAVDDFLQWSKDPTHSEMKDEFYPRADKETLFALGYLARRSAHSRGSAVDLGVVPSTFSPAPPPDPSQHLKACTSPKGERFRGWNDRFWHWLRLSGCTGKHIKRSCGQHSTTQPPSTKVLHARGRFSTLCQGMVALRTHQ